MSLEFIGLKLILILKNYTEKIVAYCSDNPFSKRDHKRWDLCKPALRHFDLIVFHQFSRIKQAKRYNLKKTVFVYPTYNKKLHSPPKMSFKTFVNQHEHLCSKDEGSRLPPSKTNW